MVIVWSCVKKTTIKSRTSVSFDCNSNFKNNLAVKQTNKSELTILYRSVNLIESNIHVQRRRSLQPSDESGLMLLNPNPNPSGSQSYRW